MRDRRREVVSDNVTAEQRLNDRLTRCVCVDVCGGVCLILIAKWGEAKPSFCIPQYYSFVSLLRGSQKRGGGERRGEGGERLRRGKGKRMMGRKNSERVEVSEASR